MHAVMADALTFSIITPSYNQVAFIERTIQSVLTQGVAPLQYAVIDGGSTDGTVSILERYAESLWYVSERDAGQTEAVNKGITSTSGEIIGWLNSDDVYYPGTLAAVREFFAAHPSVDVVYGNGDHIDEHDRIIEPYPCEPWSPERLREVCFLCQPAVFFRRRVIERHGYLDARLQFCMDYEYWLRLAEGGAHVAHIPRRLAGSRMYAWNKTLGQRVAVHAEINHMLRKRLGAVPSRWISNYAHVVLETRGIKRDDGRLRFAILVSLLSWWTAIRWNRSVSPQLRRMTRGWVVGEAGSWRKRLRTRATSEPMTETPGVRPLRVGLDVSQTGTRKAGCGQLAVGFVEALQAHAHAQEFLLYPTFGEDFWDSGGAETTWHSRHPRFKRWPMPATPREARQFWNEEDDLDAALGSPDIVHSFNFFCPRGLKRARLVYTLHDLAFLVEPGWATEANRQVCFSGAFGASLYADFVVTMSEATRRHFLRTFPHYPEERTAVIRPPSRFPDASPIPRPASCFGVPSEGFFLHIGTVEPRKNLMRLLDAYEMYIATTATPLPLVLAGGKGWLMDGFDARVRPLEATQHILRLGYVDDNAVRWLYQNCHAFVFPSLFEGFGLPVLEALSQGAAVITSNVTSLPEVAGDAALYVDPEDTRMIADALAALATDRAVWQRLKAEAPARAALFSHRETAARLQDCYRTVMGMERHAGARRVHPAATPSMVMQQVSGRAPVMTVGRAAARGADGPPVS